MYYFVGSRVKGTQEVKRGHGVGEFTRFRTVGNHSEEGCTN